MERITIDVTRTRGSRSATVNVHVAPANGNPGSAWRAATLKLRADQTLTAQLAARAAAAIASACGEGESPFIEPMVTLPLPFDPETME
uniref:Uncharacterized protein n=1 Tax=uncultured prokaryote TaxID=198431 RepID=A0A0H5Q2D1_9ZZZZ|nr:hypothetical protein [uncultured prokaryote]